MGLSPAEKLDITELAFYVPALILCLLAFFKHGFTGGTGYLYLVILSIARIISGATGIAAHNDPKNNGLLEATLITANLGISFLILGCGELMKRVNRSITKSSRVPPLYFEAIIAPLVVGVVFTILGAIDENSNNPNSLSKGQTYLKVGIALTAVVFFLYAAGVLWTASKIKHINRYERNFLFGCLAVAPFLFVRILYALIAVSNPGSTTFNLFQPDIVVEACMSTLEEFLTVIVLLTIAFITPNYLERGFDQSADANLYSRTVV